jgi:hypothetical protein
VPSGQRKQSIEQKFNEQPLVTWMLNPAFPITVKWFSFRVNTLIRAEFKGLDDSPWLFDDMTDYMCDNAKCSSVIYKFKGTYTVSKRDGGKFKGIIETVKV